MTDAYDLERWVDADIAARRHRWVRYAALVPFAALPAFAVLETNRYFGIAALDPVSAALPAVGLIAWISTLFSPFGPRWPRPAWKAPQAPLDERERVIVARAQASAYRILSAAILLGLLYLRLAVGKDWWFPRRADDLAALLIAALVMVPSIPVALAEWSVPLPPRGGEEE